MLLDAEQYCKVALSLWSGGSGFSKQRRAGAFTEGRGGAHDFQEIERRILKTASLAAAAVTHVSCVITYKDRVASCHCFQ